MVSNFQAIAAAASFALLSLACGSETDVSGEEPATASVLVTEAHGLEAVGAAPAALEVNGCTTFLDLTDAEADRNITWDFSVATAANRCMKVRVGQTVTWNGNLSTHPLAASGGDTPSAIDSISAGTTASVTFTTAGTFGYVCTRHRSMKGAIYVVP